MKNAKMRMLARTAFTSYWASVSCSLV